MARYSKYNRNYPGKRLESGTMPCHDAQKIVQQYMNHVLTLYIPVDSLDKIYTARMDVMYMLSMALDHTIRVSSNVDITYIKNLVNSYMADHSKEHESVLKLVCSFIEALLHESDSYRGFNNFYWSKRGSTEWHNDGSNMATIHSEKYNTQEYHRVYY